MALEDEVIADLDARGVKPGNAKPWQDAIAGKAGRDEVNADLNSDDTIVGFGIAGREYDCRSNTASAPARSESACRYEPKRATEQECARELWRAQTRAIDIGKPGLEVGGQGVAFSSFIACTLHLPVLMHDQFVSEYQLVRIANAH